ncbi:MAG: hypothetical protein GTN65_11025, partial [Armatimonadetes bacterium]|nr:hypothetical protein [Armatimonadota bacterium]NIO97600.1 hypothetical protein [Armatimonadota bacterium]
MQKQVKCPKCKTPQPLGEKCVECGLDFKEYARKLKEKRAAEGAARKQIKCPWCKTTQPLGEKCVECGLDFKEYARKVKSEKAAGAPAQERPVLSPDEKKPPGEKPDAKPEVKSAFAKDDRTLAIKAIPRPPELSSIGELMSNAWLIYKGRLLTLLGLYLLSVVILLVPIGASFGTVMLTTVGSPSAEGFVTQTIIFMFGLLIGMLAWLWGFGGFISAACDEMQNFKEALGSGWRNMWSLLWVYLIVGCTIQGGLILFILPGLVWTVSFFAAQFIIFEEHQRGMDAMLKSRAYVKGHWWAVFGRLLLIVIILILASVVPLGGILLTPFMMIYMVLIYKELRTIKGKNVEYARSGGARLGWITIAAVGCLVPLALMTAGGVSIYKARPNLMELPSVIMKEVQKFRIPGQAPPPIEEQASAGPEASLEPQLKLFKAGFFAGEKITVRFQAPSTYAANAWVGLIPSTVPHGSEAENDQNDISKQFLGGITSGDLEFTAPTTPGIYDLRMFDTDDGGAEVVSITFAVEDGSSGQAQGVSVRTVKRTYAAGEPVDIEFSGLPGNSQDWITVVPVTTPENVQGEFFTTSGVKSGIYTFGGLEPGSYEVRVYFD